MRKLLFFEAVAFLLFLIPSCSYMEGEYSWYDEDAPIEVVDNEDEIPESPWKDVINTIDPVDRYVGTPHYMIYVIDEEGRDLLDSSNPDNVIGDFVVYFKNTDPDDEGNYYREETDIHILESNEYQTSIQDRRNYISLSGGIWSYKLVWTDGATDTITARKEYNRDKTKYRFYFLLNGKKQYSRVFYLIK